MATIEDLAAGAIDARVLLVKQIGIGPFLERTDKFRLVMHELELLGYTETGALFFAIGQARRDNRTDEIPAMAACFAEIMQPIYGRE